MLESVFVGALLNPLLPFILGVLHERDKLCQGIKKDIRFISEELPMIAAAIEQHQSVDVNSEEVRRQLLEQWRELAHEMEVCIGLFAHTRARERLSQKRGRFRFRFRCDPLGSHTRFARRLQEIRERLVEAKRRPEQNAATGPHSASPAAREPSEPDIRLMSDTVGMDDPLAHLLQLLLPPADPAHEDKKHKVISIVGPGGVGKTLLATTAYQRVNRLPDPSFSPMVWVRVADKADVDVLRDILAEIGTDDDAATINKGELIKRLRSKLECKRYLIVIDDVRKLEQWTGIKPAFPDEGQMSSRVIMTTTIQIVADACSFVYKMGTLDKCDSITLFYREASLGQSENAVAISSAELMRKCDGLPLALVSSAQFVKANKRHGLDFCAHACNQLGSFLEKEKTLERMQWVLASKYNSLGSSALKARLLYFCTFNCANPISRNSLIRRWLAEGLIDPKPRRNCSMLREEYSSLSSLIDQNIIRSTGVSNNGKVKTCQPFGMVFEYISYKAMVEKMVLFPDQTPMPEFTRWLSLHRRTGDFSNYYPRTLAISGSAGRAVLKFANCEAMRVLDLENCSDLENGHLKKICDLLLLKYLSLGKHISKLPRKISQLEWLETLDLRNTSIEAVPLEVIMLPQLTHLLGKFQLRKGDYTIPWAVDKRNRRELKLHSRESEQTADHLQKQIERNKVKEFLQQKSKLETLAGFVAGRNRGFPQLMPHMRRLRKVKIWCDSNADDRNLADLSAAIEEFIYEDLNMPDTNDRSLLFDFEQFSPQFKGSVRFQRSEAPGRLGSLKLRGPAENMKPILTLFSKLSNIKELCLSLTIGSSVSWNDLVLAGLTNLKALQFLKLDTESIEGDQLIIQPNQFEDLSRMCLVVKQRLPQITIQAGALKRLISLHLICPRLDGNTETQIQDLTSLKEVALHSDVAQETQNTWRAAASRHPNKPNVLLI